MDVGQQAGDLTQWAATETAAEPDLPTEAVVVTSWRHTDGRWPGRARHLARTVEGCERLWPQWPDWQERVERATEVLPEEIDTGDWFPRLEARSDGIVVLARPAPPRRPTTRLWTAPEADGRRHPAVKGPDLHQLSGLRDRARGAGADDAVLCTPAGTVLEAAHGTLVWWSGERLASPPVAGRLASVTEQRLRELAARREVEWVVEDLAPSDLAGHEVWLVSALHGISQVTSWRDGPTELALAPTARAQEWHDALASMP